MAIIHCSLLRTRHCFAVLKKYTILCVVVSFFSKLTDYQGFGEPSLKLNIDQKHGKFFLMKFSILQVKKSPYIEWAGFRNGGSHCFFFYCLF